MVFPGDRKGRGRFLQGVRNGGLQADGFPGANKHRAGSGKLCGAGGARGGSMISVWTISLLWE